MLISTLATVSCSVAASTVTESRNTKTIKVYTMSNMHQQKLAYDLKNFNFQWTFGNVDRVRFFSPNNPPWEEKGDEGGDCGIMMANIKLN